MKRSPYAERCTGAKREHKRQRDRDRRAEQREALLALRILRALLTPEITCRVRP